MNVLLLDQTGAFVDFAMRCAKFGHIVKTCMAYDRKTGQRRAIGDGLMDKIEREEWSKWVKWADLIVCSDNVKWLRELDVYRKKGFPVFSPSAESAEVELNREKGQSLFAKCGLDVMPYESFTDYRKAEKFVRADMKKRWVSKPNGDVDKALSYVSKSGRDMLFMLQRWASGHKNEGRQFMLQEFVAGQEFGVNGWLGPKGFCSFIEEEKEQKKMMSGDWGQNTGQMGGAIRYTENSALAREILLPLERDLIKLGHTGSFAVSCIVDEEGSPRPLEATARCGWPSFNIVQCLHDEPVEWMANLLDGEDTFRPSTKTAVGIVAAIPDFPVSHFTKKEVTGVPLYNVNDDNEYRDQIHLCEIQSGVAPSDEGTPERCLVSCGDYLVVATGLGNSVSEAAKEAYTVIESMEVPNNLIVRDDIGECLKKELPILQEYGFCLDWKY